MTRVAITNAVMSNAGDAAIALGIISSATRKGACQPSELVVFDSNATTTQQLYSALDIRQQPTAVPHTAGLTRKIFNRAIRIPLLQLALRASSSDRMNAKARAILGRTLGRRYAEFDCVVSSGGTYLVDHYDFRHRVVEMELAKAAGCRTILWTQSMGPFASRDSQKRIRRMARVVDAVYFRDEVSEKYWDRAVDYAGYQAVVPDAAFALAGDDSYGSREAPSTKDTVSVSVRAWSQTVDGVQSSLDGYRHALTETVRYLIDKSYQVTAVSTCQGIPSYRVDDSAVAAEIFEGIEGVEIEHSHYTPAEIVHWLSGVSLVVTTRMHFAILALVCRVPVIAIAYEFKTEELFRSLGLGALVVRIEDVTDGWLRGQVDRVLGQPSEAVLDSAQLEALAVDATLPIASVVD